MNRKPESVSPVRTGADRIDVVGGDFFIESPLIYTEGPGYFDPGLDTDIGISSRSTRTNEYVTLLSRSRNEEDNITISHSVALTPEQAREIAVTLWAGAERIEANGGDES